MHCIPGSFLKHEVGSPWQMTKEDKTDPESEASVEDKGASSVGTDGADSSTKKTRRRRRRRRRRKNSHLRMMNGSAPITILKPPRVAPMYPSVPAYIRVDSHTFATPAPPRQLWTSTNPMVIGQHLALDCEMVGVGPFGRRSVLARVSIVNWNSHVVLDTFVKVTEPVTDYRTFVSGVRPCDLESPHAMDFGECRLMVHQLLQDKILVGHGLENDLKVLRLSHPWHRTRDTATYEPFMQRACHGKLRASKLKDLAESQLGVVIQGEEHNSVEDARCAMELYKGVQQNWEFSMEWKRNMEAKMGGC